MSKKTSLVFGVITGIALGSVLGMLFAPAIGRSTRQTLKTRLRHAADKLCPDSATSLWESGISNLTTAMRQGLANNEPTDRP